MPLITIFLEPAENNELNKLKERWQLPKKRLVRLAILEFCIKERKIRLIREKNADWKGVNWMDEKTQSQYREVSTKKTKAATKLAVKKADKKDKK